MRVLAENPKRWSNIYALSRRPPTGEWPSHVQHIAMDFLTSPGQLADQLKTHNIKADYVFFFAYIQPKPEVEGQIWSAVDELVKVNS